MDKLNFFVRHLGIGALWKLRTPIASNIEQVIETAELANAIIEPTGIKRVLVFRSSNNQGEFADQLYHQLIQFFKKESHFDLQEMSYSNDAEFEKISKVINHVQYQGLMVFGRVEMDQSLLKNIETQNNNVDGIFKEVPFIVCPDMATMIEQPILKKTVWNKYIHLKKYLH